MSHGDRIFLVTPTTMVDTSENNEWINGEWSVRYCAHSPEPIIDAGSPTEC